MSISFEAMCPGDYRLWVNQMLSLQHYQRRPARQRACGGSFLKGWLAFSWNDGPWLRDSIGSSRPGGGVKQTGRLLSTGVAHAEDASHSESELFIPASSRKKLMLEPFSDPEHVVGVTSPGVVGEAALISLPGIPEAARKLT